MREIKDLTGQKFGRLEVLSFSHKDKNGNTYLLCCCECGNEKIVRSDTLKSGSTKSCGCITIETPPNMKYGLSKHPLQYCWTDIKQRCYNSKNKRYKDYGGRGIIMCDEWRNDFKVFYDWAMQNGYKKGLSIDRINNDGNYEPTNCRFTTMEIQQNNRRDNKLLIYKGEVKTISQWSKIKSIKKETIRSRLNQNWSIEKTLDTTTN